MADNSRIEWTEATWNPVVGCSLASPGCTNCYAMPMARRIEAMQPGSHYAGTTKVVNGKPVWTGKIALAPEHILTQPLRWRRPRRIFVNSMGDLFHEAVPDAWIDQVFAVMALTPQHTFQVLTKRSARMRDYCTSRTQLMGNIGGSAVQIMLEHTSTTAGGVKTTYPLKADAVGRPAVDWAHAKFPNVWLGVSTEDQRRADERVPDLLETPAAVRFVSAEPLLGPLNLFSLNERRGERGTITDWHDALRGLRFGPTQEPTAKIDLVIVGGESGPRARPMHPDWARSLRDQCAAAGVPFFFKQWGEWHTAAYLMTTGAPVFRQFATFDQWVSKASTWVNGGICLDSRGRQLRIGGDFMAARDEGTFPVTIMHKAGKRAAGRLLDGVEHNGMPEVRP